ILTSYVVNTAELDDSKRRGILAKKFEATLDKRTSKVCRDHDQRIIPIDKIKIGVNAPPLHPYCRSHLSDMLEGLDYDSEDELMRMIEGKNNHISSGHGNKIYPINDNVVNNLNGPNVDNLTQAENDVLLKFNKELLIEARDSNNSMEVAFMFNGFEEKIYKIYGTESELDLGSFDYKYVLHNHPNNEFFSNKDLAYFATHPKTKLMGIVKHNGDILYLEKSKDFNFKKYYTEYNRAVKKFSSVIENNEQLGYNKVVREVLKKVKGLNVIGE
ncbi:phage minor head protein, partial [Helcococcus ovis]|uniref:phage minor head protein n=1 Tax=Helcococcus ovis TaxID=72026 RepID=UPI0038BC86F8